MTHLPSSGVSFSEVWAAVISIAGKLSLAQRERKTSGHGCPRAEGRDSLENAWVFFLNKKKGQVRKDVENFPKAAGRLRRWKARSNGLELYIKRYLAGKVLGIEAHLWETPSSPDVRVPFAQEATWP